MDRKRNTTDAYVEIHWHDSNVKLTDTIKGTLDPEWNTNFTYEKIDDEILQEHPFEFKVYNNSFAGNQHIGTVLIELSMYLTQDEKEIKFQSIFPIFHPADGISGELTLEFKIDFIRDENEFKHIAQAMLVHFFSSMSPPDPNIYKCNMLGFAEELVSVNLTDKSVELIKILSETCLQIRRNIAKRVLSQGGNSIIAYNQDIEFEYKNSKKLSVRGYGTIAKLTDKE